MSNCIECSECKNVVSEEVIFHIDDLPVCRSCLFGPVEPVNIYPIGFVHNNQWRDEESFGLQNEENISKIVLLSSQKRFMYKLEEESKLTIVYFLHKSQAIRSKFKRGLDGKEVGVFASRTPDRLSPIGIQNVELKKIHDTIIFVEGLDAINHTPVLDIKLCWEK
ncbi:MAG: TrmO family methyltransferase domain-containing protein [Verrucomicrobiota bacterium]